MVHECEVDFEPAANLMVRFPCALMRGGAVTRAMRKTLDNLRASVEG